MKHRRQRMSFVALQLHYPTAALMWVGGGVAEFFCLSAGATANTAICGCNFRGKIVFLYVFMSTYCWEGWG
jgi:hypothetical protein